MFHLFTHAFFKAMLFLGAGSVITAMHHEQDMRNYGDLRKKIPLTFWAMMIGTLAITGVGIPLTTLGFAGFLSKDAIIESAFASGQSYAFWLLVIAAMFTSFYSWRLMFMTFWGEAKGDQHAHDHAHESPWTMTVPLGVLALGAVFAGMIWIGPFFGDHDRVNSFFGIESHAAATEAQGETSDDHSGDDVDTNAQHVVQEPTTDTGHEVGPVAEHQTAPTGAIFMHPDNHVLDDAHHVPNWVKVSPFVAMLLGLFTAYMFYIRRPDWPARMAANQRPLYLFLLNKWYFDELYDWLIIGPAKWLGDFLWKRGDGNVIDGTLNGIAMGIVPFFTRLAGKAQSGYLFHYAFAMVIGITILITWMVLGGSAG